MTQTAAKDGVNVRGWERLLDGCSCRAPEQPCACSRHRMRASIQMQSVESSLALSALSLNPHTLTLLSRSLPEPLPPVHSPHQVQYMVDASTATGTCAVCIVGGERSLVANLAAANNFKVCGCVEAGSCYCLPLRSFARQRQHCRADSGHTRTLTAPPPAQPTAAQAISHTTVCLGPRHASRSRLLLTHAPAAPRARFPLAGGPPEGAAALGAAAVCARRVQRRLLHHSQSRVHPGGGAALRGARQDLLHEPLGALHHAGACLCVVCDCCVRPLPMRNAARSR